MEEEDEELILSIDQLEQIGINTQAMPNTMNEYIGKSIMVSIKDINNKPKELEALATLDGVSISRTRGYME